jgi:phage FluMu protein Com
MIHTILNYDSREYGERIAICGKVLTQMDSYTFKLDEITCTKCKTGVINEIINSIDKKINIYSKYNKLKNYVDTLIIEKEKYKRML